MDVSIVVPTKNNADILERCLKSTQNLDYEGELPVLVTVYFPLTERYFKGGGTHADKILP